MSFSLSRSSMTHFGSASMGSVKKQTFNMSLALPPDPKPVGTGYVVEQAGQESKKWVELKSS